MVSAQPRCTGAWIGRVEADVDANNAGAARAHVEERQVRYDDAQLVRSRPDQARSFVRVSTGVDPKHVDDVGGVAVMNEPKFGGNVCRESPDIAGDVVYDGGPVAVRATESRRRRRWCTRSSRPRLQLRARPQVGTLACTR